jgi:predicted small lipoprotein YifL
MRRLLTLILAVTTCATLGACGYKGPLVHPAPAATATPATPASTPASARSD